MTDQQSPQAGSVSSYVKVLFSPGTMAALRYALTAITPLVAVFGFTGLTPDRINSWVAYAQQFGTAALAVMALLGIVVPVVVAIFGVLSSRIKVAVARVRELAMDPKKADAAAAQALTDATRQLANSPDVRQSIDATMALVKATQSLDTVQNIVTDKAVAEAAATPGVVSSAEHEVVTKN